MMYMIHIDDILPDVALYLQKNIRMAAKRHYEIGIVEYRLRTTTGVGMYKRQLEIHLNIYLLRNLSLPIR